MSQRVNHGACKKCGSPVLYLGADFCSPSCDNLAQLPAVRKCESCGRAEIHPSSPRLVCAACEAKERPRGREVLVLDSETELMRPGCMAPALACVSWATPETYGLIHHTEARSTVVRWLEGDQLLAGHHIAYDFVVFCAAWPDLIPLVFRAYEEDRVTDTLLREKLVDIATVGRTAFAYNLGAVAKRRLGAVVDKKDEWRLRFGELISYPLEQWPEQAKRYAQADPVVTLGIYQQQERDRQWLADQFRQARASFWLQLMSVWGLHTDEVGVREFATKTQQKYDLITQELVAAGLMREKRTKKKVTKQIEITFHKNTKIAQARMASAWSRRGGDAQPNLTTKGIGLDSDNCERSGDALLQRYAEHSSIGTLINTFIPLLWLGVHTPIHQNFDSLLVTGRTSTSPNYQNFPTSTGPRECFVPRPGFVFAVADYAGMELHTWAQVCFSLFGFSDMAKALNSGIDPHTQVAATILGISYEEAKADYEHDPKGRVYLPRQSGKIGNFGQPGGLGLKRLVAFARSNYGVVLTDEKALELRKAWRNTWREAPKYLEWVGNELDSGSSGAILILQKFVGRYRGKCSYTEGANSLFQALASDCAKEAGFLIARACYAEPSSILYGCRPVHFIHDEWLTEVPDDHLGHDRAMEVARLMKVGADKYLPDAPSRVEPLLARRWSKKAKPIHGPDGRLVPWDLST